MKSKYKIGDIVGNWTLLSIDESRSKTIHWKCRCICENLFSIQERNLSSGKSRQCRKCSGKGLSKCRVKDITGQKFHRLLVIKDSGQRSYHAVVWECLCDCGNITYSIAGNLRRTMKSCGCLNRELFIQRNKDKAKHGMYKTKEYKRYCENKRRELKKNLDSGWTLLMDMCLRSFFPACVVCGTDKNLSLDHVIPLSAGEGLYPGNAVILCTRCNSIKKERSLENLPVIMGEKITKAAESFRVAWSGGF